MGLLSGSIGGAFSAWLGGNKGSASSGTPLAQIALQIIQRSGGLTAFIDRFKQAGLGQHVDSWVSTGPNLPLSTKQVGSAIGPDLLPLAAAQSGLPAETLSENLSKLLPDLIDRLTPQGQVPADHQDMISNGISALLKSRL